MEDKTSEVKQSAKYRYFRLLGFRVEVRPGFLVFLGLVVFIYGGSLGLWAAGSIAVFTLIHELGHAAAARATGAHAEISLDFLAGYASYLPSRPLTRWERAGIAAAGPLSQFTAGCLAMLALGANPFVRADIVMNNATISVWWAGIVLAVVNLIPVTPLDGGAIVSTALEKLAPRRGTDLMLWFSIIASSCGVIASLSYEQAQGLLPFAAILLMMQLQLFGALRRQKAYDNLNEGTHSEAGASDVQVIYSLQQAGQHQKAAEIGAEFFRNFPRASIAAMVATSLTKLGDHDGAQAWMRAAEQASLSRL